MQRLVRSRLVYIGDLAAEGETQHGLDHELFLKDVRASLASTDSNRAAGGHRFHRIASGTGSSNLVQRYFLTNQRKTLQANIERSYPLSCPINNKRGQAEAPRFHGQVNLRYSASPSTGCDRCNRCRLQKTYVKSKSTVKHDAGNNRAQITVSRLCKPWSGPLIQRRKSGSTTTYGSLSLRTPRRRCVTVSVLDDSMPRKLCPIHRRA
jgi:hypothetical protein